MPIAPRASAAPSRCCAGSAFPIPAQAFRTYPFELSGGLRQRAMIAMALVCDPALLIADEPTTALDVTIQAQILQLMQELQKEFQMAILFITHDLGVVANMADDVVVLYRGRVMESGSCTDLSGPAAASLSARPAACRAAPAHAGRRAPDAAARGAGQRPRPAPATATARRRRAGPLLEVQGLRKSYRIRKSGWFGKRAEEVLAVDDVSFTVERGESFGLVGESGCGKTTVSKAIMRAVSTDAGTIVFHADERADRRAGAQGPRRWSGSGRRLQYMFQDPFHSLNPRMTVYDIVAEPLVIHGIATEKERVERVKALLAAVGLDVRHLRRYPHSFSGGQRQRIGIARALALGPEMLICDEPVSALDVSVQAQILNLLKDLQSELGLTYLFISHNLAVVKYICQRIAVMCAGRIVEVAPRDALFARPVHPYTRALLAAVPEPDLSQPLDFSALMAGKSSEPTAWPAPFTLGNGPTHLADLGGHHSVRMSAEANVQAVHYAA